MTCVIRLMYTHTCCVHVFYNRVQDSMKYTVTASTIHNVQEIFSQYRTHHKSGSQQLDKVHGGRLNSNSHKDVVLCLYTQL